jgi:hypothetical protein
MSEINLPEIAASPLTKTAKPENFLRLVLAEAGRFGMPGHIIATIDDLAAMLGYYDPLPKGVASHLAGPFVAWRTHPAQPSIERIHDVEELATKQRALVAFGGAPPGHMVGTAEIVAAMHNSITYFTPPEFIDLYRWAAIDVLAVLQGITPEEVLRDPTKKGWTIIEDDEVLKPSGRLYSTYLTIATTLRREVIAHMEKEPRYSRENLRPLAVRLLEAHRQIAQSGDVDEVLMDRIKEAHATIMAMFPDLVDKYLRIDVVADLTDATSDI